jgi:hypothetical protein
LNIINYNSLLAPCPLTGAYMFILLAPCPLTGAILFILI